LHHENYSCCNIVAPWYLIDLNKLKGVNMKKAVNKKTIPNHPMFVEMGKVLKSIRVEKGMTQAEVAEAIGVHSQFVSNWERGLCAPPKDCLPKLRETFRIGPKTQERISHAMVKDFKSKMHTEFKALVG
jgi:DNA-binding XRE family transcriptional regulator